MVTPDIESSVFHIIFLLDLTLLTYNFFKAWRSDPGYLKSNREDKIKVFKRCFYDIAAYQYQAHLLFPGVIKQPAKGKVSIHCYCISKYSQRSSLVFPLLYFRPRQQHFLSPPFQSLKRTACNVLCAVLHTRDVLYVELIV